jgi:starvation-inducible outer membrane lipoprotein
MHSDTDAGASDRCGASDTARENASNTALEITTLAIASVAAKTLAAGTNIGRMLTALRQV